jgi:LmbE family N-acetylglucosaminyl deacetylase
MTEPLRLLAVFPHPDDESLGLGGVLAKYAAEGVETHLICATRGQRGWPGPAEDYPGPEAFGRTREIELRCAARHLGLHQTHLLGYCDGELDQVDFGELIAQVASIVRRIRPQVVVTFAQDGVYGHPDHIVMAQGTSAALVCAADASYQDPEGQAACRVPKYYAVVDTRTFVDGFKARGGSVSMVVDGIERSHVGWEEWTVGARIDVRDYFDPLWRAVLSHQSQIPSFGPLVSLSRGVLKELFAESTLVRNYSLVTSGLEVETDLFEGIKVASPAR